jgi:hypothetical protein
MITTRTGMVALSIGILGFASCAPKATTYSSSLRPNGVVRSPSRDFRLIHDAGDSGVPAAYRLYTNDGELLGTARSIITNSTFGTMPAPPAEQVVKWSQSERTVVIHENMSDDFPDHSYRLMQRNGTGTYDSRAIQLTPRGKTPAEWPTIDSTTDSRLKLRWKSDPKSEYIPLPPPQA